MPEIKWRAPEYEYQPKDISWYWLVAITVIVLDAIALWQKNLLFAIFILIAAAVVIFWGRREPQQLEFKLGDKGLYIDKKFIAYDLLDGFAIKEDLFLKKKSRLRPGLKILLPDSQKESVKKHLLPLLPEVEYRESLAETLAKLLKF